MSKQLQILINREYRIDVEKIHLLLQLVEELQAYEMCGIPIMLEGRRSTPVKIAEACVLKEESNYMRDYVENEKGGLAQLRFDKIKS